MSQSLAPFELLKYEGADGWAPLPEWAQFMLGVGATAATFSSGEGRLVVAVSVPTRSFAAALAGAGSVVAAFAESQATGGPKAHFKHLSLLPSGTPITHWSGNSSEQGRLLGVRDDLGDSKPRLVVELPKVMLYLPEELCERIQVIDASGDLRTRRRKLIKAPEFLTHALPGIDAQALSASTSLDCVIIGVLHALEFELTAEPFAAGPGLQNHEGSLQGIVRARRLAGENDPYRSELISASSEPEGTVADAAPTVAIFDGATAFNNWRFACRASNWVVVIDRSSPSIDDAAAAINQSYAARIRDSDALDGLDAPAGVEVVAYLERR
jgi:hypothetical protein